MSPEEPRSALAAREVVKDPSAAMSPGAEPQSLGQRSASPTSPTIATTYLRGRRWLKAAVFLAASGGP
eukprot:CAMPEP_0183299398 /NCGR_PEP_ID=MMETSP0160_2-20130417/6148_1 /TAXON_ID=2839 ORGANISM="Odontella Sinensis, Strain Grunow 1884" /NCGR_SAMPLE_ID=MMETSP0160_2 /ASSEMBLY_ACC=CAM_ASM_000250 /LENGTH=67 /DNA_ID=CAMNT_0025461631 /DNA_START=173 /DNA_END=376 /DNA_ORIENTATION=+